MLAKALGNVGVVILDKVRPQPNRAEHLDINGRLVKGKTCILIDDIIDTGGTIASASELLRKKGAQNVLVSATHPVLSRGCLSKLKKAKVTELVVTNTIEKKLNKRIKVLDILPLVLEEIQ